MEVVATIEKENILSSLMQNIVSDFFVTTEESQQYGSDDVDEYSIDEPDNSDIKIDSKKTAKLASNLKTLLNNDNISSFLLSLSKQLVNPNKEEFTSWLVQVVIDTFGEAILQACITSSPKHVTGDNLLLDLNIDDKNKASIWVTETTLGGAGVLESFATKFSEEPDLFFSAIEAALAPTDLELVDLSLRKIVQTVVTNNELSNDFLQLRSIASHNKRLESWHSLASKVSRIGSIHLSHALSVALNTRLLRPGSDKDLDKLLGLLLKRWEELEVDVGFSLSIKEFCFIVTEEKDLFEKLKNYL